MIINKVTYRRDELERQAGRLLKHDRDGFIKLSQKEQEELVNILLEIEGLNIKFTGPDPNIKNQVSRTRKKKTAKNKQLILIF